MREHTSVSKHAALLCAALLSSALSACSGTVSTPETEASPRRPTQNDVPIPNTDTLDDTGNGGSDDATNEPTDAETDTETETPLAEDDTPLAPAQFCDAPNEVFLVSCGNGSCHSSRNATIGGFAVDEASAYDFVDRMSVRDPSCGRLIDSRDYSQSLILTKVNGTYPAGCGGPMPVGSFVFTQAQVDCLASWLQQFQSLGR